MFKEVHFVPQAAFAKHIAMIRCNHDDGVIELANLVQRAHNVTDLAVEIGNIGIVGVPCIANFIIGSGLCAGLYAIHQPL